MLFGHHNSTVFAPSKKRILTNLAELSYVDKETQRVWSLEKVELGRQVLQTR